MVHYLWASLKNSEVKANRVCHGDVMLEVDWSIW